MKTELWNRLKPLLHAALNGSPQSSRQPTAASRTAGFGDSTYPLSPRDRELDDDETLDRISTDPEHFQDTNPTPFRTGDTILDRFRIVRPIGRGGMGEVYEAEDLQLGQIALKTIRYGIGLSADTFERFRQEVQLARRISGPQVCRIHELFLLPATNTRSAIPFLTMEYLEGSTLSHTLRRDGPLPWKKALPIALEICEGLRLIHEKGIIHRDLKSANIMVCDQGRVVLMDFGLASTSRPDTDSEDGSTSKRNEESSRGMLVGTPEYMAPEQFEGNSVSAATDIYALGIVLYELVTGLHPFAAHTPIGAAIRRARNPAPPSSIGVSIPRHWDHIIARCLQYEPERRFASATDVAKALTAGPVNIENIRRDRPWAFRVAAVLLMMFFLWGTFAWWQTRQYQRPNAAAADDYNSGIAALHKGTNVRATVALQHAVDKDGHYVMGHVRLAEALLNLDSYDDAKQQMLLATEGEQHLAPLDRMYLDAVHATIDYKYAEAIALYKKILERLPAADKSSGYVDLGLAYERAADPAKALECYARGAQLNDQNPASFLHEAVLQSRLHHVPEADQAFSRAEELFKNGDSAEGSAEFNFERGYAYNDRGQPALAEPFLQRALDEAEGVESTQLKIRALTQLSSVATGLHNKDLAVQRAQQAIDKAKNAGLDSWTAIGLVRLANAEIMAGQTKVAEAPLQEAMQLARRSGQLRTQAIADVTLASLMDQEHHPDQVIALAQPALDYYKQNGFFAPAANASMLLVRAEVDKGEYIQALQSGKISVDVAMKSGARDLMAQSEETIGNVYLQMEDYPHALSHYQNAKSLADVASVQAYQDLHCAEVLWKLGRYVESDAMLQSASKAGAPSPWIAMIRVDSLLSQHEYPAAVTFVRKTIALSTAIDSDDKRELLRSQAIAMAHLGTKREVLAAGDDVRTPFPSDSSPDAWSHRLDDTEIDLQTGNTQKAYDASVAVAAHFASTGQMDSALRSVCIAASAAKRRGDLPNYRFFLQKAVDILPRLQQTWGPDSYHTYLARQDIEGMLQQIDLSAH